MRRMQTTTDGATGNHGDNVCKNANAVLEKHHLHTLSENMDNFHAEVCETHNALRQELKDVQQVSERKIMGRMDRADRRLEESTEKMEALQKMADHVHLAKSRLTLAHSWSFVVSGRTSSNNGSTAVGTATQIVLTSELDGGI